jgi:hypothetical protein
MFSGGDGTLFNFNWFDLEYSRGLPQDTSTGLPVELRTFPNPFVSGTRIAFSLDKTSQIDLKIYSSTGQLIKTLVANETFASGNYQFTWNATDNDQGPLQAGIYIIRFMCNHQVTNAKVVLLSGNGYGTFSQFP